MLGGQPLTDMVSSKQTRTARLWIRRVLVRSQEGQLEARRPYANVYIDQVYIGESVINYLCRARDRQPGAMVAMDGLSAAAVAGAAGEGEVGGASGQQIVGGEDCRSHRVTTARASKRARPRHTPRCPARASSPGLDRRCHRRPEENSN